MKRAHWWMLAALTLTWGATGSLAAAEKAAEKKEEQKTAEAPPEQPCPFFDDCVDFDFCSLDPCFEWNPCSLPYGLNPPPVCPNWDCCDWVATLEYLYWKPFVENAHAAQEQQAIDYRVDHSSAQGTFANGYLANRPKDYKFNWDSGFRVGLGYNFPCDKWGMIFVWTHYRTAIDSRLNGSASIDESGSTDLLNAKIPAPYFIMGDYLEPFFYCRTAEIGSKWTFQFNQVDLDFFRDFYVGCALSLRPYAGLRSIFLAQKINVSGRYNVHPNADLIYKTLDIEQRLLSEFKGFGIKGGLKSNWEFFCGLSLYGDVGLSAVYSCFTTMHRSEFIGVANSLQTPKTALTHEIPYDFNELKVFADFALGLEWRRPFNCNQNVFHFRLGWEHHMLFKASHFLSLNNNQLLFENSRPPAGTRFLTSDGDISLYGFVFAIGVSF